MRVLWITNIMLPPICVAMGFPVVSSGGWIFSSLKRLVGKRNIEFAVATVYNGSKFISKKVEDINYYLLPLNRLDDTKYQRSLEKLWISVKEDFGPDIVHIHGTEFAHGLAYIKSCGADNVVISIQGLVSVISRYYCAGISRKEILQNITFRDFIKRDNILQQQKKFYVRGEIEKEYIMSVQHVIGRTSWDKAHVKAINPVANYYFCNETLRDEFYKHSWNYDSCEKYSIFSSQAGYPIKGLHQILKAMPLILRDYPDTKLYVAGVDITKSKWYRISGYGSYLKKLIKNYNLENVVIFTGVLSEKEICQRYLKSNVFICSSSIENSPNSLGEAQLLGVPCIASFAGGIPDMMCGYEENLYRFEEVEMLATKVISVFKDSRMPSEIKISALRRHNTKDNSDRLLSIYQELMSL